MLAVRRSFWFVAFRVKEWTNAIPRRRRQRLFSESPVTQTKTMHISKENFDRMMPVLEQAIQNSDFVALDLEFSGLNAETMASILPNDTVRTRYLRMRHAVRQMQIFQFGLALFRWDETAQAWKGMPFSFYLLPRKGKFVNCVSLIGSGKETGGMVF